MKRTIIQASLALVFGVSAVAAQANTISNGQTLTIKSGVPILANPASSSSAIIGYTGSWFSMGGTTAFGQRVALFQGVQGLVLGSVQSVGSPPHTGAPYIPPYQNETSNIVAPWSYFSSTGKNFTTSATNVLSSTTTAATVDLSGWTVAWNNIAVIPMGTGAWGVGFTNAQAKVTMAGANYVLDYRATVPAGDPSNFGGVQYAYHQEGVVICGTCSGLFTSSPVDGAKGVDAPTTTSYAVTFTEAMSPGTITSAFLTVSGGVNVGNPTPSAGNKVFTFPLTGVAGNITYSVTPNFTGVTAVSGNGLVAESAYVRKFTTFADVTPPTITGTTPAAGAKISPSTGVIVVDFSEPVTGVTAGSISIGGGVTVGAPTGSNSNKKWTFPITSGNMQNITTYNMNFNAGPKDPSGNLLTPKLPISFTTLSGPNPILSAATKDKLLICPGSKFGMEVSPGNPIYTSITGQNPISIGVAQPGAGAGHSGAANGGEAAVIDKAWTFFGNAGIHFTQTAIMDYDGKGTLDFKGWRVAWNQVPSINMGSGQPAIFEWDGVYGNDGSYKLTYLAIVPLGDPSGFGGVPYDLHLEGKVLGGKNNVTTAVCGTGVNTPSGVLVGINDPFKDDPLKRIVGKVVLNSQLRPDDNVLAAAGYSAKGRPDNLDFYKYGLITYTINGLVTPNQTIPMQLTLPAAAPAGSRVFKVGPNGYRDITAQVTFSPDRTTLSMDVVDDGPLDSCNQCRDVDNKFVIVDPIAIGIPFATGTSGDPSGSKGGGCAYNPAGKFDPMLPMLLLSGLGYFGWKRARRVSK